jgi:catechol 2,3-dioxygenase-like lactoylglutathione lyase family enzyme
MRVLWFCLAVFAPNAARAAAIDLTRHVAQYSKPADESRTAQESFFGVSAPARLIVTGVEGDANVTIRLNGSSVVGPHGIGASDSLEIPVALVERNAMTVTLAGPSNAAISIRVKQLADIELHVHARVHFNTNVANFAAAREFYGKLGFETLSGFPDTNTQAMARAIGIQTPTAYDGSRGEEAGGYLLHGELIGPDGFSGGLIDLIEFTIPKNDEPPYPRLNHLGMARAAMHTTDIAADYQYLKSIGVDFMTQPATRSDGTRFAVFRDPDGTHYELIEVGEQDGGDDGDSSATHIVRLAQVNVNVSDFERASAWYQMLGYEVKNALPPTDSIDVARAMGFAEPFQINGALLVHPSDGSALELVQWIAPSDPESPYPVPVNHLGIHRMAFSTSDIEADVAALAAQGVQFISPITPCCSGPDSWGSIVGFYDPDGTVIELVEQPVMSQMFAVLAWLKRTFR